jgi:hypothetical protein
VSLTTSIPLLLSGLVWAPILTCRQYRCTERPVLVWQPEGTEMWKQRWLLCEMMAVVLSVNCEILLTF